jgi:hypothetical protein
MSGNGRPVAVKRSREMDDRENRRRYILRWGRSLRTLILVILTVGMGSSGAAFACWQCTAGPGEECYLEEYWSTPEEIAQLSDTGRKCSANDEGLRFGLSTGAQYRLECTNGRITYLQTAPNRQMLVRPIGAGDKAQEIEADKADDEARRLVGADKALAICEDGAGLEACREAHSAMIEKARNILASASADF